MKDLPQILPLQASDLFSAFLTDSFHPEESEYLRKMYFHILEDSSEIYQLAALTFLPLLPQFSDLPDAEQNNQHPP